MKVTYVETTYNNYLKIHQFGSETESANAKWGPGLRKVYILHYVLRGKGYFNGASVRQGQGFLITENKVAHYFSSENDPWQYFWIIFSGDGAEAICNEFVKADKNGIFTYETSSKLLSCLDQIFEHSELSPASALSCFYNVLSFNEKCSLSGAKNHYVERAKENIRTQVHLPVSVTSVAETLGISDRYLYNLFIRHEGISPKQFINNVKLSYAEQLLQNSKFSVAEIAASVGFYDSMAFSRFFTQKKGISPSKFRKLKSQK